MAVTLTLVDLVTPTPHLFAQRPNDIPLETGLLLPDLLRRTVRLAEFVEDDEIEPRLMVGNAPGKPGKRLGFEPANEIDNVVEPDPGPAANTDQGLRGVRGGI